MCFSRYLSCCYFHSFSVSLLVVLSFQCCPDLCICVLSSSAVLTRVFVCYLASAVLTCVFVCYLASAVLTCAFVCYLTSAVLTCVFVCYLASAVLTCVCLCVSLLMLFTISMRRVLYIETSRQTTFWYGHSQNLVIPFQFLSEVIWVWIRSW